MTFVSYNSNTTSVTREAVITLPESTRVRLQFLEVFMVFNLILLCSTLWILVCFVYLSVFFGPFFLSVIRFTASDYTFDINFKLFF